MVIVQEASSTAAGVLLATRVVAYAGMILV